MQKTWVNGIIWAAFALTTLAGGYAMLRACDLGIVPLFGAAACAAPPVDPAVAAERERQDKLRADLHAAEMQLAQLPICLPPKPPEPKPQPKPEPKPEPKIVEKFEVPKKIEDLKGCWQSARGDIDIVSDDPQKKSVGKARFCYCFRSDGRGTARVRYTNGNVCSAQLTATIKPDSVFMHHDVMPCSKGGSFIGENITCRNDASNETSCEIQNLGNTLKDTFTQDFVRVTEEYCNQNN